MHAITETYPGWSLFLLFILAYTVIEGITQILNRVIRHLNLRKSGWPPMHLDADGDWKSKDNCK